MCFTASDRAPIAFSTPPEALQKATDFADASCLITPGVKRLWRSKNVFFNVGWLSNCVDPLARRAHRQPLLELCCARDWEALSDMLGVAAAALPGSLTAAHAPELVRPARP